MNSDFALALHALVYLSHKHGFVSSTVLAENICTNPVRVRRVLSKLCKANIVKSSDGPGGYSLILKPEDISLKSIAEVLNAKFTSTTWSSGDAHMECRISSGMAGITEDLYEHMNGLCQDYLACISIADIDKKLFAENINTMKS